MPEQTLLSRVGLPLIAECRSMSPVVLQPNFRRRFIAEADVDLTATFRSQSPFVSEQISPGAMQGPIAEPSITNTRCYTCSTGFCLL